MRIRRTQEETMIDKKCPPSFQFSSIQFSRSVMSDSLRPHESQHTRPPCPSPSPGVHSDSRPSSPWCHPAISSSVVSFSSRPQSTPQHQSLFQWVNSSHEVAKVLEFQLQHHSFQKNPRADLQNGLVGSPCSPRDSQESPAMPQIIIDHSLELLWELNEAMCVECFTKHLTYVLYKFLLLLLSLLLRSIHIVQLFRHWDGDAK